MASNTPMALPPYLEAQLAHIDDDRRAVYIVSTAVCLSLAFLAVVLRFLARSYSAKRYGWDDWMMIPALILGSASVIDDCIGILFGGGQHLVLLLQDPVKTASYGKNTVAAEALYGPALFTIKLSILLLYARIFTSKKFRIVLWIAGAFITAYTICSFVVPIVQCTPLNALWDPTVPGTCINITAALTAFGALNILTDFVILMLPIPMIWNLQTSAGTKLQISGLFLTGTLVTVISIARVVYLSRLDPQDATWTETDCAAWTIAEISTAIISACLPTYRPLFDKTKRKPSSQYILTANNKAQSKLASEDDGEPLQKIHVQTSISNTWADRNSSRGQS